MINQAVIMHTPYGTLTFVRNCKVDPEGHVRTAKRWAIPGGWVTNNEGLEKIARGFNSKVLWQN